MKIVILIPVFNDWQSVYKLLENINSEVSLKNHYGDKVNAQKYRQHGETSYNELKVEGGEEGENNDNGHGEIFFEIVKRGLHNYLNAIPVVPLGHEISSASYCVRIYKKGEGFFDTHVDNIGGSNPLSDRLFAHILYLHSQLRNMYLLHIYQLLQRNLLFSFHYFENLLI